MQKQFPTTSVPNLQSFPENGYPVSAFYGIDSTLADVGGASASGNAASGTSLVAQIDPSSKFRTLATVILCVVGAYALWHYFTK